MTTTFEHLAVELLHQIFAYFQFHELLNTFSNLNCRLDAIVNNLPHMPVYVGLNGMNITLTEFYWSYLLRPNICTRLTSLCVSDTKALDNGSWLASHASAFINLRHLSLIDIARSSFEHILDTFPSTNRLVILRVRFTSYYRAAHTFDGVPEGAYHEQIFRLFPFLHTSDLSFWRYITTTVDDRKLLPLGNTYIPIQTNPAHLRHLTLRECSPYFLTHLLEQLPLLEELNFTMSPPWLPDGHSLMKSNNRRMVPIKRHLAPNLRALRIDWCPNKLTPESVDQLLERDVFCALTKFHLWGIVAGPCVIRNILSMLSDQCAYTFDVDWHVPVPVPLSETSGILSNTFVQLKGRTPIELELWVRPDGYSVTASAPPEMKSSLCVDRYLRKDLITSESRWPPTRRGTRNRQRRFSHISMSLSPEVNGEFLSCAPAVASWNQIISLNMHEPFDFTHLTRLLARVTRIHTLQLHCELDSAVGNPSSEQRLINLLSDTDLCEQLMLRGPQQLYLDITINDGQEINLEAIAYLIVERFPLLEVLELSCVGKEMPQMLHILINGLPRLSFLTIDAGYNNDKLYNAALRTLRNSNTRSFRTEVYDKEYDGMLFVWLR